MWMNMTHFSSYSVWRFITCLSVLFLAFGLKPGGADAAPVSAQAEVSFFTNGTVMGNNAGQQRGFLCFDAAGTAWYMAGMLSPHQNTTVMLFNQGDGTFYGSAWQTNGAGGFRLVKCTVTPYDGVYRFDISAGSTTGTIYTTQTPDTGSQGIAYKDAGLTSYADTNAYPMSGSSADIQLLGDYSAILAVATSQPAAAVDPTTRPGATSQPFRDALTQQRDTAFSTHLGAWKTQLVGSTLHGDSKDQYQYAVYAIPNAFDWSGPDSAVTGTSIASTVGQMFHAMANAFWDLRQFLDAYNVRTYIAWFFGLYVFYRCICMYLSLLPSTGGVN